MAKFCSKCGMKLNEQTGKCPNCDEKTKMDTASSDSNISINGNPKEDQNIKKTNGEQEVKKESKKKTIVVITIVIVVLLIGIGVGIGVFMVHNEKTQMFLTMAKFKRRKVLPVQRQQLPMKKMKKLTWAVIMKFPNLMQKHISEKILP